MKNIKTIILSALFLSFTVMAFSQKHFTKDGDISFFSDAAMEKIEAHNNRAAVVLNTDAKTIEAALLVKGFQFEKALMQEHFNENYMESDKFPKAVFKGEFIDEIDFTVDGEYPAKVKGELTIHGVTKPIETEAKFTVKNGAISAFAKLDVACADYDIKIPNVVVDNISKEIEITIEATLTAIEK